MNIWCDDIEERIKDDYYACQYDQLRDLQRELESKLIGTKIPVVGNYYRDSTAQKVYASAKTNDLVGLEFDPTNKFDSNAICVLAELERIKPIHIGWINRDKARQISLTVSTCLTNNNLVKFDIKNIVLMAKIITRGTDSSRMIVEISQIKIKGV